MKFMIIIKTVELLYKNGRSVKILPKNIYDHHDPNASLNDFLKEFNDLILTEIKEGRNIVVVGAHKKIFGLGKSLLKDSKCFFGEVHNTRDFE